MFKSKGTDVKYITGSIPEQVAIKYYRLLLFNCKGVFMNTLENKIQIDLVWAMKNKDASKVSALRSIKTAIMETKTASNGKKELEDNDIIKIIQKLAKQRNESADIYEQNGRLELAENERKELDVLNEYLPKMLTEQEIEDVVIKVIADLNASSMKDMGKVMGYINKTYAGQVDGSVVSRIVKSKLMWYE